MVKILLYGEIGWDVESKEIVSWLDEHKDERIEMHVNSPGGQVFEAIAIRNAVKGCPDLTIVVDSLAASAAAVISLCGKPLKMSQYSRLMIHSASTYAGGNSKAIEKELKMLQSIDEDLAKMIAEKMGASVDEVIETYFDGKDHWLTQQECLEMGIAEAYEGEKAGDGLRTVYDCVNGNRRDNHKQFIYKNMELAKIKELGAFRDCATEDDVVEKANEQARQIEDLQEQTRAKDERIAELEARVSEYEAEQARAQAEADENEIADALESGKITAEQADIYRNLFKNDRENARKMLASLAEPAAPAKVSDFIKGEGNIPEKDYFKEEMARIANQK